MKSQKAGKTAELVMPGGDLARVKIAFMYGADAVYVGLDKYSLRKAEVRFSLAEIKNAIDFAHSIGKKLYVTFNIFAHNKDLAAIRKDMAKIASFGPDAFIIADPGVFSVSREVAPQIPVHISTQANTVNSEDVKFWAQQGVKRVVLARELTLPEIKEIHAAVPDVELEAFVHGAMCISYSGRCLLSNYMTGRSANLGECAQPCRWQYNVYLEEKLRPGELFAAEESETGTTIMSSKDLRLIKYLPQMLDAGIKGLKIEGRNKTDYYLATTGLAYSEAIKLIKEGKYTDKDKKRLEKELEKLNYRDYTTGFILGEAQKGETTTVRSSLKSWNFVAKITGQEKELNEIIVKNQIIEGDQLEALTPEGVYREVVQEIFDEKKNKLAKIDPGRIDQKGFLRLGKAYPPNTFLRKKL